MMQVMLIEMWGTFLFTMVILNATNQKTSNCGNNSSFAHYTLCLALLVAIYICAPISGGGMNPAVAVGLNLMAGFMGKDAKYLTAAGIPTPLGSIWPYIVGPLLGATLAGLLQKNLCDVWCDLETMEDKVEDGVDMLEDKAK
jgi:aquaporin Z